MFYVMFIDAKERNKLLYHCRVNTRYEIDAIKWSLKVFEEKNKDKNNIPVMEIFEGLEEAHKRLKECT